MGDLKYCLCCGDEVPFNFVVRHERKETTCTYCGFVLDVEKLHGSRIGPQQISQEGYALVSDDSKYTRRIIEDLLREKKYSSHVMSFENGLELTSAYSKMLSEKKFIDLAIIDLNMPVMDGLTAARTIRALEAQNEARVAPIVFFSAEKCDENLKIQMETLGPANYVNKGSDPDPDKLAERVEFLLSWLAEMDKEGTA